MTYHHFCYIFCVIRKLLNIAHTYGRGIKLQLLKTGISKNLGTTLRSPHRVWNLGLKSLSPRSLNTTLYFVVTFTVVEIPKPFLFFIFKLPRIFVLKLHYDEPWCSLLIYFLIYYARHSVDPLNLKIHFLQF